MAATPSKRILNLFNCSQMAASDVATNIWRALVGGGPAGRAVCPQAMATGAARGADAADCQDTDIQACGP